MKCDNCETVGDWLGTNTSWEPVGREPAAHPLYECIVCGNRQWAK
ncbi:hypothetical protein [Haladaptatus sp. DJG-WS-42]